MVSSISNSQETDMTNTGIDSLKKLVEESGNLENKDFLSISEKKTLNTHLPNLQLLVWLDDRGLYSFKTILANKGYTDIDSLAAMNIDAVMKLAKEINMYSGHILLLQELDELRKEGTVAFDNDVESDTVRPAGG